MKDIKDYIDQYGMIVTKGMDGGDSCAHGFSMIYASLILNGRDELKTALGSDSSGPLSTYSSKLELAPGRYVRHPDKDKWYSDLDRLSRDQFLPILAALGLVQHKEKLNRLFKAHLKRGLLFAWNTRKNFVYKDKAEHELKSTPDVPHNYKWKLPDLTGPEVWAAWIRAYRCKLLYPLLLILDLENLVGSVKRRMQGMQGDDIQMNHVVMTDFATRVMPTPVSLLSRFIYGKKCARWALNNKWGRLEDEPPVNQYLVPLVESWKTRE